MRGSQDARTWRRDGSGPIAAYARALGSSGFAASIPFMDQTLYVGPVANALGGADIAYLVGFVVAGVIYWGLENYWRSTAVPAA